MKNSQKVLEKEVLFQKLGSTWYIFTEIKGEIVYSVLPDGMEPHNTKLELYHLIEDHLKKVSKVKDRSRNTESLA